MDKYQRTGSRGTYEAIFLQKEEICSLFEKVRGEAPYEREPKAYHVTTEYMPHVLHPQFYGEEVRIHIVSYRAGEVMGKAGVATENEGFGVEFSVQNKELEKYLSQISKQFHITGSFRDEAKYTEYLDFENGEVLDFWVTGVFGCCLPGGEILFEQKK